MLAIGLRVSNFCIPNIKQQYAEVQTGNILKPLQQTGKIHLHKS